MRAIFVVYTLYGLEGYTKCVVFNTILDDNELTILESLNSLNASLYIVDSLVVT